ncbi:MAG: GTP cyclohydrolase I [Myxococcota bacterium]
MFHKDIKAQSNGPVILTKIGVHLICPHHLTVAFGEASVAYIPGTQVASFGAISDLVQACTARLTFQETATQDIVDNLAQHLQAARR